MPGWRSSFARLRSTSAIWASDRVASGPVKYAQEYLRVSSWNSPKKSSETS